MNAGGLPRQLGSVRDAGLVLGSGLEPAAAPVLAEQCQHLDQSQRAHFREVLRQLTGRDVPIDVMGDLVQDGSRVHPGVHLHDRHARLLEPVDDRPLDRRRAPQLGQERGVDVDHPLSGNGEQGWGEDVAVGDHDADVRHQSTDPLEERGIRGALRLQHRDAFLRGRELDGWCDGG